MNYPLIAYLTGCMAVFVALMLEKSTHEDKTPPVQKVLLVLFGMALSWIALFAHFVWPEIRYRFKLLLWHLRPFFMPRDVNVYLSGYEVETYKAKNWFDAELYRLKIMTKWLLWKLFN